MFIVAELKVRLFPPRSSRTINLQSPLQPDFRLVYLFLHQLKQINFLVDRYYDLSCLLLIYLIKIFPYSLRQFYTTSCFANNKYLCWQHGYCKLRYRLLKFPPCGFVIVCVFRLAKVELGRIIPALVQLTSNAACGLLVLLPV